MLPFYLQIVQINHLKDIIYCYYFDIVSYKAVISTILLFMVSAKSAIEHKLGDLEKTHIDREFNFALHVYSHISIDY